MRRCTPAVLCLVALACAAACQPQASPESEQAETPPEAVPRRVESQPLGLAIAAVPRGFELEVNEGETLRLEGRNAEGRWGTITVEVEPPQAAGVNLVKAVNEQKQALEARPEGKFMGQVELGSPLGTAFSTRGRYRDGEGATMEESRVFAVHPMGDRLLSVRYVYPAGGDSEERLQQLFALLGEIEILAPAAVGEAGDGVHSTN